MFWKPSPELTLSSRALSGSGVSSVDLVREFGLTEKTFPEFRSVVGGVHKIRVSRMSFKYDAEATIQGTFVFRNRTFTIGAPASTDIEWNLWTFGYEWNFIARERGFLGAIVDLKRNHINASVNSPLLASPAETDLTVYVPTVGGVGRLYLVPVLAVTAEFTGLDLNLENLEVKINDFDIYATLSFGRNVGVQGGYRALSVNYLVDGNNGGILKMKGPYFGAVVRY